MITRCTTLLVASIAPCFLAFAAVAAPQWGFGDGNWTATDFPGGHWYNPQTVPSGSDVPYITYNGTITVDSGVPSFGNLNLWSGGKLLITTNAGLSPNGTVTVGHAGSTGRITQDGGTFNSAADLLLGPNQVGTRGEYYMSGGTLSKTGGRIYMGQNSDSSSSALFEQTGGTVSFGPSASILEVGYNSTYNLQDGLLDMGGQSVLARRTGSVFNQTGGTLQGVGSFAWGTSITQNGGLLKVGSSTAAAAATAVSAFGTNSYTLAAGTVEFEVFGSASTDCDWFEFGNASQSLDLSSGLLSVSFNGYLPQVGDSWDFIRGPTGTLNLSTSNISAVSGDGGYLVDWDTTAWMGSGVLGVNAVSEIVVPEPSVALLVAAALLAAIRRGRR